MRYEIIGEPLPVVICHVCAGETLITERGSMSWMSPNMKMETTTNGGIGKALGRMFSGDSIFQNRYTAMGGEGMIAFASSFPGSIRALEISPGNGMIVQKSAFWPLKHLSSCRSFSRRGWEQACLEARALSCRNFPAKVLPSLRLTDMR